ncbi:hypothetical protein Taro_048013 [Colocasia esculenta]|uniref:Trehalose 6-phosphate phosphatase n=1 Tax=Colocasia esculenta TaxID=4460 RepID=A0A843X229_COLES|nr:hypothetical protein [Colocasia esculenta]
MTKQRVTTAEAVPPAAAARNSSPVYPCTRPRSAPVLPLGKKLLKQLEASAAGTSSGIVSTWVEALRASSPQPARPPPPLVPSAANAGADNRRSTWMMEHPSALGMFDEIANLSEGKQIVMFLDYDGTLSPIVDDPERAFMSEAMRAAVRDVARYLPTVIVTGRCRQKVYSFVRLAELYYAGSHGMDIKGPKCTRGMKSVLFQPASEFLPIMDEVYRTLTEKTKSIPGAKVENNKFCVSVHFRCVDEKRWVGLAKQVQAVLIGYPKLRVTHGRKVLEVRPTIKWDKGKALEFLLESLGFANSGDVLPVYIGDDQTDEDAFKVLRERGQGLGILVSKVPRDTNATYSLQEPSEAST